jgi:hypothetical protein
VRAIVCHRNIHRELNHRNAEKGWGTLMMDAGGQGSTGRIDGLCRVAKKGWIEGKGGIDPVQI